MKTVRMDVDGEQFRKLRQEVFCNQHLTEMERRREVRRVIPLPLDGSKVDLYCDGEYVGTV